MEGTVFEHIMVQTAGTSTFQEEFVQNIESVYEYDATEIQEFLLTHDTESEDERKEHIRNTRQLLFEKLCEKSPQLQQRQLYNRRKVETMASDVYCLGNSLVNGLTDRRLAKVLKPMRGPLASQSEADDTVLPDPLINNADLSDVCADLKVAVNTLVQTVKDLSKDIRDLKQEIDVLKQNNVDRRHAAVPNPAQTAPQSNQGAGEGQREQTAEPPHETADAARNNVLPPSRPGNAAAGAMPAEQYPQPHQNVPVRTHPGTPRDPHRREANEYHLQPQQRREAIRGTSFTSSQRREIQGSSSSALRIQGATSRVTGDSQQLRSIYIGQLHEDTTPEMIRDHLNDISVSEISDVIKLNSRVQHQASFCVIVDNETSELAMYNPDKWPPGVRIRPYKERSRGPRGARGSQGNRPNQQGRGHHHKRNGNQRRQNSHAPQVSANMFNRFNPLGRWIPSMFK